jgi:hypothetical protein
MSSHYTYVVEVLPVERLLQASNLGQVLKEELVLRHHLLDLLCCQLCKVRHEDRLDLSGLEDLLEKEIKE